jgi:WD40 repeat protein
VESHQFKRLRSLPLYRSSRNSVAEECSAPAYLTINYMELLLIAFSIVPSGQTMQVFSGHTGPVQAGTFAPDGKRLLTGCARGSLILWEPRSGSPVWKLSAEDARFGMEEGITCLAVNAAGTVAVVGGAKGEVRVLNLSKGEVLGKLEGHGEGDSIEAIEFMELGGGSNSAGVVVTGGTDGKVCIWDLTTMRLRVSVAHSVSRDHPSAFLNPIQFTVSLLLR